MNIAHILEDAARFFPTNLAVIEGDRTIRYTEFNQDVNRIASALVMQGVQAGDHVGMCAPNSYGWLCIYFGALKAGAVAVTFSNLLKKEELSKILSDCKPKVLFTTDEKLADLPNSIGDSRIPCVISDHGDISLETLKAKGNVAFKPLHRDRNDTAAILYTGGTTGTPKGAMLSHMNLKSSVFNIAYHERCTPKDRALCFLPLNHVFGQVHIMSSTVFSCGATILQPSFDMQNALDVIEQYEVTKFYAVPTIYIRLLGLPGLKEKFRSIRYCFSAAASMAMEVVREWKQKTGLDIFESYGMTESAAMVTYNHYYQHKIGSVGTPVNIVDVQIRDAEGNVLKQGEQGEICICGPNITRGYLNNPDETRSAFWGQWYRSGDVGVFDEDGYLFIVDRLKDMIITGGENVYPREVEEILYTLPEVLECAVIGLPDAEYGERVTAFIVPQAGQRIDSPTLKAHLKTRLANYKVPKEFIAVAELPKSSTGKLLKRQIRSQYHSAAS